MEALSWLSQNWQTIALTVTSVIGGASIIVASIAPLTKTDADDKAAGFLDKVHGFLSKLALNSPPKK